ncbi:MAG: hypothetical protein WCA81_05735 [Rhizomicrobium sp.]
MTFLIVLVAIALVVVAPMFLCFAMAWERDKHPKATGYVLAGLVIAVLLAALTFHHFFPSCHSSAFRPGIVRC